MKNFINCYFKYLLLILIALNIANCGKKSDPEYPENYIDYRYESIKKHQKSN